MEPAAEQIMLLNVGKSTVARREPRASVEEPRLSVVETMPMARADWEPDWDFSNDRVAPLHHPLNEALDRESHRTGWGVDEPEAVVRMEQVEAPAEAPASRVIDESFQAGWSEPVEHFYSEAPAVSMVDPQPIHGNLIEFPYELVAARKVRPRRAEGIYGATVDAEPQLSIFEVDPASVSTQPEIAEQPAEVATRSGPEWAELKLAASEQQGADSESVAEVRPSKAIPLQAAPMNLRVLAAVVDFGLVSLTFLAVAALVVVNATVLPTIREAETGGAIVFAAIAVAYLAISYTLARATPGMKYALLSMRTFDGRTPNREQRCKRLGALALAMLPVGLGAVWALFDEEHLAWHDRLSGTYLRRV
jgi:uncharacterized RDD family membrane protein YckC